jgi:Zn-dependent M28 family amino/carboxypeptidase
LKIKFTLFLLLFCFVNLTAQQNKDIQNALSSIDSLDLKYNTLFLSDDLLEGRLPGTYGDKVAAKYIATQFESYGVKPAGTDLKSYFQKFNVFSIKMDHDMLLKAQGRNKNDTFQYYTEFIGFCGTKDTEIELHDKEVVFVGYGIEAPDYNWNDYKDIDVNGKILLMMNNDPSNDPKLFAGKRRLYYGRWDYKYDIAAKKGAIGAIIIHTDESASYGWEVVQSSWSEENFDLSDNKAPKASLNGWLTYEASKRFVALSGHDIDELMNSAENINFKPLPLNIKINLSIKATVKEVQTSNVFAYIEGSDAKLKNELVIYTSHFDHLGVGVPIDGDSIYNGAFDNATGVSSLISLAKAFSKLAVKPKRSILFAAVTGEEQGLLGSEYYAQNPTFPLSNIIACINIDAINIFGETKNITVIDGDQSNLFDIVNSEAKKLNMFAVKDRNPEHGLFYRSDQFSFAKQGVPSIYISNGDEYVKTRSPEISKVIKEWEENSYHQPNDEVQSWWDFAGMAKNVKLFFLVGNKIANDTNRPTLKSNKYFNNK